MRTETQSSALRSLPSVDSVLGNPEIREITVQLDRSITTQLARESISHIRAGILEGHVPADPLDAVLRQFALVANRVLSPRLHEVINGTGVLVHTNLGRAPVSRAAAEAMSLVASRYTPLELEIDSGKRGGRMSEISEMLRLLTGAEASLVVNNNAAAVMLVLSELCNGKDVVLSRSQAVEIGGGFRIPDVLVQSGARLVEVGTTNKTYVRDYEREISEETGALLTVHWSNFRIVGFTAQPDNAELALLADRHDIPLIEDLGSGSLLDTAPFGLPHEPTVTESIEHGVDVVCFSGDKLLGGPQAGIISGRKDLVDRISAHPLARAMRADKTALAGIAETLRHYIKGEALAHVPVWQMISASSAYLRLRCEDWIFQVPDSDFISIAETRSAIGGGSLPDETLPSWGLVIETAHPDSVARALRSGTPSIMPHIDNDRLIIDARTVLPEQDRDLIAGLTTVLPHIEA